MTGERFDDAARAAEAAARRSYGKLIAFLAARTHDVAGAEDALSEAFAAALADWPVRGVPNAPDAWLLTVARRKRIDAVRKRQHDESVAEQLHWLAELAQNDDAEPVVPDQRLGLLFACAHPGIDRAVRAPLMLQVVLGFDAATIASAFLIAPATMGQRLARAKTKIRQAGIGFDVPERSALRERLDAVLEAIYAAYAEGWSDPEGADARRRNLAEEAIWLGRLAASLLPDEGEALGLLSLMLHAHARRDARRNASGEYVPLAEQDTSRWDASMIDEAEALLSQANRCGRVGRYQLEAAVQSAHAVRRRTGHADWAAIEQLYDALCALTALTSGGAQPRRRPSHRHAAGRGTASARRAGRRHAARRLPAVLGRARRLAGAQRRTRRRAGRVPAGHRPGARPRGAPLSAAARGGDEPGALKSASFLLNFGARSRAGARHRHRVRRAPSCPRCSRRGSVGDECARRIDLARGDVGAADRRAGRIGDDRLQPEVVVVRQRSVNSSTSARPSAFSASQPAAFRSSNCVFFRGTTLAQSAPFPRRRPCCFSRGRGRRVCAAAEMSVALHCTSISGSRPCRSARCPAR